MSRKPEVTEWTVQEVKNGWIVGPLLRSGYERLPEDTYVFQDSEELKTFFLDHMTVQ